MKVHKFPKIFLPGIALLLVISGCGGLSESKKNIPLLTEENVNSFIVEQKKIIREEEDNAGAHYGLSKGYLLKKEYESAERHARLATRMDPLNAAYYEQLGTVLYALQRFSDALTELGTATDLDPERVSAYLILARTFEQIGDTSRAIAVLEEILQRDRYYAEALLFLARLQLRQHEYDSAIRVLDELIRLEPSNREALLLRIQAYSTQGSFYYARTLIEEMIREHPNYEPLQLELLRILFSQQQWDEATMLIEKLESQTKTNAEISLLRAYLEFNRGDLETAQKQFLQTLELDPRSVDALLGLASLSLRSGKLEEALDTLNQAVEINTRLGRVHFLRSTVLFRMGDYLQGDLALQRAIENDPQEPIFQLLSLRRRLMKGEIDSVEQSLLRLQEKYPLKMEVLQLRASLAAARGDYENAEELLSQARVTHQSPLLDFSLARIYYLQRKYRSVLALTTPLLDQLSGSWEVVYLHALSLAPQQSWQEALEISRPYLNNPESRGFAHRLVGDLYLYQGKELEAQKIYRQGLENHPDHLFLIESLSSSLMLSGNWEENEDLLVNTLEKNERLQGNPSIQLVLLDRLALTLQQLGKKEQMRLVMSEYHQRNDPMLVNRMFSMEEQLLFPISSNTVGPEWLFLPQTVLEGVEQNQ